MIISFLESLILASFGHCSKSSRVCPRGFSFKKIFLIEILFHFFMYVGVLLARVSVHCTPVRCLWIPEEDVEFSGTGVIDGC